MLKGTIVLRLDIVGRFYLILMFILLSFLKLSIDLLFYGFTVVGIVVEPLFVLPFGARAPKSLVTYRFS